MNRCGCQKRTCTKWNAPVDRWLAAVLDKYVTMGRQNQTLTVHSGRADMEHVSQFMAVMMDVCERHIAATRTDVAEPRTQAGIEILSALSFVFEFLSAPGPTLPVSYSALLTMACFAYQKIPNRFIRPRLLTDFLRLIFIEIRAESVNVNWLLMFYAHPLQLLLEVSVFMVGLALYKMHATFACSLHFEAVVEAVAAILTASGYQIFCVGPNNLEYQRVHVCIQDYIVRARAFLDGVELLVKIVRNFEEVFRGIPGMQDHPRWPARYLGSLWKVIEKLPDAVTSYDPYCLREYAIRLRFRVRHFMPPPPKGKPDEATPCPWTDREKDVFKAVRPFLLIETSKSVEEAVAWVPAGVVPNTTHDELASFFILGKF